MFQGKPENGPAPRKDLFPKLLGRVSARTTQTPAAELKATRKALQIQSHHNKQMYQKYKMVHGLIQHPNIFLIIYTNMRDIATHIGLEVSLGLGTQ